MLFKIYWHLISTLTSFDLWVKKFGRSGWTVSLLTTRLPDHSGMFLFLLSYTLEIKWPYYYFFPFCIILVSEELKCFSEPFEVQLHETDLPLIQEDWVFLRVTSFSTSSFSLAPSWRWSISIRLSPLWPMHSARTCRTPLSGGTTELLLYSRGRSHTHTHRFCSAFWWLR